MNFPTIQNQCTVRGFTLIELMVVIIVIGIVGGIVFSGAGYLFEKQAIKTAQAQIEVLNVSLDEYKREFGIYPETIDFMGQESSQILLHSLFGTHEFIDGEWTRLEPDDYRRSLIPLENLTFLPLTGDSSSKFDPREVDHYLTDPWGEPYIYEFPRKDGNTGVLLYSKGPDKKSDPFSDFEDMPDKRPEDLDNIPPHEPGNW